MTISWEDTCPPRAWPVRRGPQAFWQVAFRGQGHHGRPGLPRAIAFDDERMHAALAPALGALGVEAVLDADDPELRALAGDLGVSLGALAEPAAPRADAEPEDLPGWKAADVRATELIAVEVRRGRLVTPRALRRYFGSGEAEELARERASERAFAALIEWLAADYRPTKRSRTLVEKLLERSDVDPGVRAMLAARRDAVASIFRVDAREPGGPAPRAAGARPGRAL